MIRTDQTIFDNVRGNCFQACVASILELPLMSVPHFCLEESWFSDFVNWAKRERKTKIGYGEMTQPDHWFIFDSFSSWSSRKWDGVPPKGYSILSGESPRFPGSLHSVVALDGAVIHDPRVGDRRGVLSISDWIVIGDS